MTDIERKQKRRKSAPAQSRRPGQAMQQGDTQSHSGNHSIDQVALTPEDGGSSRMAINIAHHVTYVAQDTEMSCWSAATSMLFGGNLSIAPGDAQLDPSGGLPPNELPAFARAHRLQLHMPQSWTVAGLARLLERGPLMVVGKLGEADESGESTPHAVVIGAIVGDGTAENTRITVYDPADGNAEGYTLSYEHWLFVYPEATWYMLHR